MCTSFLIILFTSSLTFAYISQEYKSYPFVEEFKEIQPSKFYNSFEEQSSLYSSFPSYTRRTNYYSLKSNYSQLRSSYTTKNYFSRFNNNNKKEKEASHSHWSYENQNSWSKTYSDCSGNRQSPINIETNHASISRSMNILFSNEYINCCKNLNMTNNGHTIKISFKSENKRYSNKQPWISGKALDNKKYILEEIHFHWGSTNNYGSEHTIDGQSYPLEMHYVHYNKRYSNFKSASKKSDGLVVIATLFDIFSNINRDIEPLMSKISDVRCRGESITIKLNVYKLFPLIYNGFFKYKGSLTTPPCYESVTWIVLKDINTIGREQLIKLRSLYEDDCKIKKMMDNYRFQQKLNSRDVVQSSGRDISIEN